MNIFNTPNDAIDACDRECDATFLRVYGKHLNDQIPKQYQEMLKIAFKTGFMAGVQFLSSNILRAVPKEDLNQIKKV